MLQLDDCFHTGLKKVSTPILMICLKVLNVLDMFLHVNCERLTDINATCDVRKNHFKHCQCSNVKVFS